MQDKAEQARGYDASPHWESMKRLRAHQRSEMLAPLTSEERGRLENIFSDHQRLNFGEIGENVEEPFFAVTSANDVFTVIRPLLGEQSSVVGILFKLATTSSSSLQLENTLLAMDLLVGVGKNERRSILQDKVDFFKNSRSEPIHTVTPQAKELGEKLIATRVRGSSVEQEVDNAYEAQSDILLEAYLYMLLKPNDPRFDVNDQITFFDKLPSLLIRHSHSNPLVSTASFWETVDISWISSQKSQQTPHGTFAAKTGAPVPVDDVERLTIIEKTIDEYKQTHVGDGSVYPTDGAPFFPSPEDPRDNAELVATYDQILEGIALKRAKADEQAPFISSPNDTPSTPTISKLDKYIKTLEKDIKTIGIQLAAFFDRAGDRIASKAPVERRFRNGNTLRYFLRGGKRISIDLPGEHSFDVDEIGSEDIFHIIDAKGRVIQRFRAAEVSRKHDAGDKDEARDALQFDL